jgi:hypothetical protein
VPYFVLIGVLSGLMSVPRTGVVGFGGGVGFGLENEFMALVFDQ